MRERVRVARRGAAGRVELERRILHRLHQRTGDRGVVVLPLREGAARDAAEGGLEAEAPREARGDADRAAAVGRRDERAEAARERGRRAAARATGRTLRIPR